MDLEIAGNLIEYKKQMSEQWLANKPKEESESDDEEEEPKLIIKKKNK